MTIAVIVDSSSAITPKLAEEFHLRLAPLHLIWDKNEYADWVDMTPEEFYTRLKTSETLPTTSGSVQGEFLDLFESLKGKADEIASQYNCVELWIGEASPVLAIHMSPESIGLAFYNE